MGLQLRQKLRTKIVLHSKFVTNIMKFINRNLWRTDIFQKTQLSSCFVKHAIISWLIG
ncbi:hypothetical protein TB2_003726 [Malus domestica]